MIEFNDVIQFAFDKLHSFFYAINFFLVLFIVVVFFIII
jgi:hypothetical protein